MPFFFHPSIFISSPIFLPVSPSIFQTPFLAFSWNVCIYSFRLLFMLLFFLLFINFGARDLNECGWSVLNQSPLTDLTDILIIFFYFFIKTFYFFSPILINCSLLPVFQAFFLLPFFFWRLGTRKWMNPNTPRNISLIGQCKFLFSFIHAFMRPFRLPFSLAICFYTSRWQDT